MLISKLILFGLFFNLTSLHADEDADAISADMQRIADERNAALDAKENGSQNPDTTDNKTKTPEQTEETSKRRVEKGVQIDLINLGGIGELREIESKKNQDPYDSIELKGIGDRYHGILRTLEGKFRKNIPEYTGKDRANYFTALYALSKKTEDKLKRARKSLLNRKREVCNVLDRLKKNGVGKAVQSENVIYSKFNLIYDLMFKAKRSDTSEGCNGIGQNYPDEAYSYFKPITKNTSAKKVTPSTNTTNENRKSKWNIKGKGAISKRSTSSKETTTNESSSNLTPKIERKVQIPLRREIFAKNQSPVNCFTGNKKRRIVDVTCSCIQTRTCFKPMAPIALPKNHPLKGSVLEQSMNAFHKAEGLLFNGNPAAASKQLMILEKNSGKVSAIRNKLQNRINENRASRGERPLNFSANVKKFISRIQKAAMTAIHQISPSTIEKLNKQAKSNFDKKKIKASNKYAANILKKVESTYQGENTIDNNNFENYDLGLSDTSKYKVKVVSNYSGRGISSLNIRNTKTERMFSKFEFNQEDISRKEDTSIFKIISNRYKLKNLKGVGND